jgi:hypothetical protein
MDNKQAKVLLSCYRDCGSDANDPIFYEALCLAKQDDDLKEWFDEDKKLDRHMEQSLTDMEAPLSLKSSILASKFASEEKNTPKKNILNFSLLAIAALLAITLFAVSSFSEISDIHTDDEWAEVVAKRVKGDFHVGYRSGNFERIEGWLNAKNSPLVSNRLARNLSNTQPVGCCTMERFGTKVSLMCFMTDDKEWLHLFIMPKDSVKFVDSRDLRYLNQGDMRIARWTDSDNAYFLVSDANNPELATRFF